MSYKVNNDNYYSSIGGPHGRNFIRLLYFYNLNNNNNI